MVNDYGILGVKGIGGDESTFCHGQIQQLRGFVPLSNEGRCRLNLGEIEVVSAMPFSPNGERTVWCAIATLLRA